jgi:hypothetical protein
MSLTIYNPKRNDLTEVAFLKDAKSQIRIMDVQDKVQLKNAFIATLTITHNLSGIKEPLTNELKADIKEMVLMRFRYLSLDEICYAFKLERYGAHEKRTEHYQLFNAAYVADVLNKYKSWKQKKTLLHNLLRDESSKTVISTEQNEEAIISGAKLAWKEVSETGEMTTNRTYLYHPLYQKGLLPTDDLIKQAVMKIAKSKVIEKRQGSNSKMSKDKALDSILNNQKNPSKALITECYRITLERFFKSFTSEEQLLNKISNKL